MMRFSKGGGNYYVGLCFVNINKDERIAVAHQVHLPFCSFVIIKQHLNIKMIV